MKWYKNINELKSFTYGATSSTSFKYGFEADNLKPFELDFELKEVPGRSGDLIIDNKRKKNKIISVEGQIDCDGAASNVVIGKINTWLCGEVKYKPLIFSDDVTRYEAIVVPGSYDVKETIKGVLSLKFQFSAKEVV